MKPTIGRVVILNLNPIQAENLGGNHGNSVIKDEAGNKKLAAPSKCPAIIVAAWSDTCVNLKAIGDSDTNLWVTSASQGDGEGQWSWPVIEK